MRHIAIFGDDFETVDRLGVANYVVKEDWPILLHPL
jgi:UDP-glucose 4-epimerase